MLTWVSLVREHQTGALKGLKYSCRVHYVTLNSISIALPRRLPSYLSTLGFVCLFVCLFVCCFFNLSTTAVVELSLYHSGCQVLHRYLTFLRKIFEKSRIVKYFGYISHQYDKFKIQMSTNMPTFGPVVVKTFCGISTIQDIFLANMQLI